MDAGAASEGDKQICDSSAHEDMKEPDKTEETSQKTITSQIRSLLPRWTPLSSSPPPEISTPEACVLQDILRQKEQELETIRNAYEVQGAKLNSSRGTIQSGRQRIIELKERHCREIQLLQDTISNYKINNEASNKVIQSLEKKNVSNEAQISKLYSSAMSTWAQDVSRDMPDDVLRSTLSSFFQGDFFSWCADMCTPEIRWKRRNISAVRSHTLLNEAKSYCSAPKHLMFDPRLPDGHSSLVLLQAALADFLVSAFLKSPYFLIDDGTTLEQFETALAKSKQICVSSSFEAHARSDSFLGSMGAAANWRVNTVRNLEATFPMEPAQIKRLVERFLRTFGFLAQQLDDAASEDLVDIFTRFSKIALKLWQTPTKVRVLNNKDIFAWAFETNFPYVECEPAIASALGETLNGRPVGVVMRPCILSDPIPEPGKQATPVVWSKALAWVSGEKDPYDIEDETDSGH